MSDFSLCGRVIGVLITGMSLRIEGDLLLLHGRHSKVELLLEIIIPGLLSHD
jgi:hypothetical protein